VTDVEPALREDQLLLALKDLRVAIGIAVDTEPAVVRVDVDEAPIGD
jgi:hypothetical protein